MNTELIQLTIKDLQDCRDAILNRHKDNISLSLRFESVFKQLINSLNINSGNVVDIKTSNFESKPLTKVFGKSIKCKNNTKLSLKPLEVDEVEAFREKIQMVYDSFLDRETTDLLDSLTEIEIRGVAKLAGVENFDKAPLDGALVDAIKNSITAKLELEKKKDEELKNLNPPVEPTEPIEPANNETQTAKLELEKKPKNKK